MTWFPERYAEVRHKMFQWKHFNLITLCIFLGKGSRKYIVDSVIIELHGKELVLIPRKSLRVQPLVPVLPSTELNSDLLRHLSLNNRKGIKMSLLSNLHLSSSISNIKYWHDEIQQH